MIQVALYARTSGQKQEKEATIKTQVKEIKALCDRQGWEIVEEYLDAGVHNETPWQNRKRGAQMMEDAAAGKFQGVVIYESGRFSRCDVLLGQTFKVLEKMGLGIESVAGDTDGSTAIARMTRRMKGVFNAFDYESLLQRTRDGKERVVRETYMARDGNTYHYWLGGRTPYGYRCIEVNRRRGLMVDEELVESMGQSPASVIRQIFEWHVVEGKTCQKIAELLTAMGIPKASHLVAAGRDGIGLVRESSARSEWQPALVQQILTNPTYKGEHYYGKNSERTREIVRRTLPAIVSKETWELAQVRLRDNKTYATRNTKGEYLLTGKLRCGYCRAAMCVCTRYAGKPSRPGVWWYYCNAKCHRKKNQHLLDQQGLDCCINPPIRETIETHVWDQIVWFLRHPREAAEEVRQNLLGRGGERSQAAVEIEERKAALVKNTESKRRARLCFEQGFSSHEDLFESMAMYQATEATLNEEIDHLEEIAHNTEIAEREASLAFNFFTQMSARADEAETWDFEKRREVVRWLVKDVVVYPPDNDLGKRQVEVRYRFQPEEAQAKDKGTAQRYCINRFLLRRHEIDLAA